MVYKPEYGKFKDVGVFYHQGVYYLFSMYCKRKDEYRNVWLATSTDGVHFTGIGPVIEDAPFPVWAMNVHRVGKRFILNHGSFTQEGVQGVIKFWESRDLRTWRYMGEGYDLLPPTGIPSARLDCMTVLPVMEEGREVYYGYPTSPYPLLRSEDGVRWRFLPAESFIEWGDVPSTPSEPNEGEFEVAGCVEEKGSFYYLGGWFHYLGDRGYHVHTLVSDQPTGPFVPDLPAYRLCGNSTRWVSIWARTCRTPDALLVSSYMNEGHSYELGDTWMPPLKRVRIDERGHMRLHWWENNDALKGEPMEPEGFVDVQGKSESEHGERILTAKEYWALGQDYLDGSLTMLRNALPAEEGVVLECEMRISSRDARTVSPWAGIYLEEEQGTGTAIWMNAHGETDIGLMRTSPSWNFEVEDRLCLMTAARAGIRRDEWHTIRLLVRRMMFELYQDDVLVQSFNTSHIQDAIGRIPIRLGFMARNGELRVRHLALYRWA